MPKLRMLVSLAGSDFNLRPGDVHEFTRGEAKRLIDRQMGELVKSKPAKVSKAVKREAPEKAVLPTGDPE